MVERLRVEGRGGSLDGVDSRSFSIYRTTANPFAARYLITVKLATISATHSQLTTPCLSTDSGLWRVENRKLTKRNTPKRLIYRKHVPGRPVGWFVGWFGVEVGDGGVLGVDELFVEVW